jgi:hypothetical protein
MIPILSPRGFRHFLAVLLLTFAGCGSLSKDAKKLMETGNYQASVNLWDQVIAKDPNDAEAIFYRNLAQSQLLNDDLVTLKGLIDSRQTLPAFEQLKKFHQKRVQWGLGLNPNSALYLRQQTERLYVRYLELLQQAVTRSLPVRALWLEKQYRALIDIPANEDEGKLKKELQVRGEQRCQTLERESATLPDLRLFAGVYCKRFGRAVAMPPALEQKRLTLLSRLNGIEVQVESLTPAESTAISQQLVDQTRKLARFSPFGKRSESLQVTGRFSQQISDRTVPLSHSYSVSIPYTDYELVSRTKSIPYTAMEEHCNADASHCWTETVTRYRQEEEKESVSVTKMRSEPRVYEFKGLETTQNLHLELLLLAKGFQERAQRIPFSQDFDEHVTSHSMSLPDIGLKPQPLQLTSRPLWLARQSAQLGTQFYNLQVDHWKREQCSPLSPARKWAFFDRALLCIRQPEGRELAWIRQLMDEQEGLELPQIAEILGPIAE